MSEIRSQRSEVRGQESELRICREAILFLKVLNINAALAAERRNVYRRVAEKNFLAPEERNVAFGNQTFRSYWSEDRFLTVVGYKHRAPNGAKTTTSKIQSAFKSELLKHDLDHK